MYSNIVTKKIILLSTLFIGICIVFGKPAHSKEREVTEYAPFITKQLGYDLPVGLQAPSTVNGLRPFTSEATSEETAPASKTSVTAPKVSEGYMEEISRFEAMVNGISPEIINMNIRQFGYDLFRRPPSTFAPVDNVPVGPDYIVGPGDELRITAWGKFEGRWDVTVQRDGTISLPGVGAFGVAGLSFAELRGLLKSELARYYTGFEMHVALGALRSIQVYVVGDAGRPGAYTLSSLSTVINALFAAGGPSKTGSMRDIRVQRNGNTVTRLDLYDLLLKGDKTADIRLMPEDVIFIPPVGPRVGIAGGILRPAIYELKDETKLTTLLDMAGGLTSTAFAKRVQVDRVVDHSYRTAFEGELPPLAGPEGGFVLQDGDVVRIFSVPEARDIVHVEGAVAMPGEYAVEPGVTSLQELIGRAGGLRYYAQDSAEVTRVTATQQGPATEVFTITLKDLMNIENRERLVLEKNDYIFIPSVPEWELYRTVTLEGEFRHPGTYTLRKGERIASVIERAGGFTDSAYLPGTVFTREQVRELQQQRIDIMVDRLERELLAQSSAEIGSVLSADEARQTEVETKHKKAFLDELRGVSATGRMVVSIREPETLRGTPDNLVLEQGDVIFVPKNPESLQVLGAVYNQSAFIYNEDASVKAYIELAGGFTDNADGDNTYIIKADGSAVKAESSWWAGRSSLSPGDTIVVPQKLNRIAWLKHTKDMTQILYQIAVTAGVLIIAF